MQHARIIALRKSGGRPPCSMTTRTRLHTGSAEESHTYATLLVTDGVPINLVQRVMGHERASTTLNRYTHTPDDYAARVLQAFEDSAASLLPPAAETASLDGLDGQEDDL